MRLTTPLVFTGLALGLGVAACTADAGSYNPGTTDAPVGNFNPGGQVHDYGGIDISQINQPESVRDGDRWEPDNGFMRLWLCVQHVTCPEVMDRAPEPPAAWPAPDTPLIPQPEAPPPIVEQPAPIPLPAPPVLLLGGMAALALFRRST